jgi:hydroxymethylpyrimidine pyrophosphatase-like HAD family hydrolase
VTDLDGTAVHEHEGRIVIPKSVELGLKALLERGRPFMVNSLRFPLSVLRTFGRDWHGFSPEPIPCVTLNGSLLGFVGPSGTGELRFTEVAAFPLETSEIDAALKGVEGLLAGGILDLLIFYYPRDWRIGEVIWTPVPENVLRVKEKYSSASAVTAVTLDKLREQLHAEEVCMMFVLIDAPEDRLMAYQHTKRAQFITHKGVEKLFGSRQLARHLGLELEDCVGAGDTEMDTFLQGVGLALEVGPIDLPFRGVRETIRLPNSVALGDVLFRLADLLRRKAAP